MHTQFFLQLAFADFLRCDLEIIPGNGSATNFVRTEQWPTSMEHVLQPGTSELGRNHSDKHQSRVELGIDDPGVEGNAREDDARASTRICRQRKIHEVKPVEASEPSRKRNRQDFDDARTNKEEKQQLPRECLHQIEF